MTRGYRFANALATKIAGRFSASRLRTKSDRLLAAELADVVLAIRAVDVPNAAATDPALRGGCGRPLVECDQLFRRDIEKCRQIDELDVDLDLTLAIWNAALTTPGANTVSSDSWYHRDLVAENLLLSDGRLAAVLDFGELGVGDPTIDLHGAWELFDSPARELFRTRVGASDADWLRGRAWALGDALGALTYYWQKMPGRCRDRLAMVQSVLANASEEGL